MKKLLNYKTLIIIILICYSFLMVACSNDSKTSNSPVEMKCDPFEIHNLPEKKMPYYIPIPASLENFIKDENGVMLFETNNQTYYHPVRMAQKTLHFLSSYKITKNEDYLTHSKLFLDKLIEIADPVNLLDSIEEAWIYPYHFDFRLGGFVNNFVGQVVLEAPWYSGMSQGQILSAFVNYFMITDDSLYLDAAEKTFNSFSLLKREYSNWISMIDSNGYFWIEEYPDLVPNHVLNGFIFAIYGLYEYYLLTEKDEVEEMLFACLTTLKNYILDYRTVEGLSKYCLQYNVKHIEYHLLHIEQLNKVYEITEDSFFKETADLFYNDFHE